MTKNRVEALTDGELAIAITVMVLELRPPEGTGPEVLLKIAPGIGTYLVSGRGDDLVRA